MMGMDLRAVIFVVALLSLSACMIVRFILARIELKRVMKLEWGEKLTKSDMIKKTHKFFAHHGWRVIYDKFPEIRIIRPGVIIGVMIRSGIISELDARDAALEQSVSTMPIVAVSFLPLHDSMRDLFETRNILIMDYKDLQLFHNLFVDGSLQGAHGNFIRFFQRGQRLSLYVSSMFLEKGDIETALVWAIAAVNASPRSAHHCYRQLTRIYMSLNKLEEARQTAQAALELESTNVHFLQSMSEIALRGDEVQEALEWINKALAQNPADVQLWDHLITVELRRGNFEAAAAAALRRLQMDPQSARAMRRLGEVAAKGGDLLAGIEWANKAVAADPRDAGLHANLISLYFQGGHLDLAEKAGRKALKAAPGNSDLIRLMERINAAKIVADRSASTPAHQ